MKKHKKGNMKGNKANETRSLMNEVLEDMKKGAAKKEKVTKRTIFFMLKTAWKERPTVFLIYLMLFVAQLIQRAQIVILPKFLMDEIVLLAGDTPLSERLQPIILFVALICGANLFSSVLSNIAYQLRSVYEEWFNEFFQIQMSDHAMKLDFEYTEDPETLDQLNLAKEGISWYSGGVIGILNSLYDTVLNVAVVSGVGIVILITCPLLIPIQAAGLFAISFFNAKNNKIEMDSYGQLAKINRVFGYVLFQLADFSYGKDTRLYDSADMMCKKADTHNAELGEVWGDMSRRQCKCKWGMDLTNAFRDAVSYFYIGYLAIRRVIGIGDFTMCVTSASELYRSVGGIVTGWQDIVKRCNYAYRYVKFLDYPVAIETGDRAVSEGEHTIEFSHVSFKYPRTENYILKDINLTIRSGEHLSVVGLNGAGKTTFIKLLCRLYDVTEGKILIDGVDIKEYSDEEYRKLFAVVFQDFKLFAFSLKENITFDETTTDEEIEHVLKQSGLYEDAKKLPNGYDTLLFKSFEENGTELSGGQQQKVAISRALYKDAPIVILDEPTAALDPIAEYDIYRQFDTLVGHKTAIYISHRLSSCKFCHRIAVFAEKTIKEYGTHDELVKLPDGIYAGMFEAQAKYFRESKVSDEAICEC